MMINAARLIADYSAACRAAGLVPAVGPATTYQCANAMAEYSKRNPPPERPPRHNRGVSVWWECDWLDAGLCRSETEFLAFLRLWAGSLRIQWRVEALQHVFMRVRSVRPLREHLAQRGKTLVWELDDNQRVRPREVDIAV